MGLGDDPAHDATDAREYAHSGLDTHHQQLAADEAGEDGTCAEYPGASEWPVGDDRPTPEGWDPDDPETWEEADER